MEETPLISLIAGHFSGRLVDSLMTDCLSTGIASVVDESAFQELVAQVERFENDMNVCVLAAYTNTLLAFRNSECL